MTDQEAQELVHRALVEILGDPTVDPVRLKFAGRAVSNQVKDRHLAGQPIVRRGGAVVWAMRSNGMSWREIYDATGIVQRTAARWMELFEAEGLAPTTPEQSAADWEGDR